MSKPVQIFGARNSGTTWIFNFLKENGVHVISGIKHANLDEKQIESYYTDQQIEKWGLEPETTLEDVRVILIGRNIFNWLKSMHRNPHSDQIKKRNFDGFIRSPFTSNLEEPPYTATKPENLNPAKNPIALRGIKYKNWFDNLDKENYDCLYINYDDLLLAPQTYTGIISLFLEKELETIVPNENKVSDSFFNNKDLLPRHFTKQQVQFILNECNLDLEKRMGFDYSNVLDYYK